MKNMIDIVKALLELDFICIDVDKRDTYIYKMLNDLVPFIENVAQLERDVKRYFELDEIFENTPRGEMDRYDFEEYNQLLVKLMEVGNEE